MSAARRPATSALTATARGSSLGTSVRAGLLQAGPLALAGVVANAANVVVTVAVARLLASGGYGALAQLTGVFLVVSTPGSAVVVAVVRKATAWGGPGAAESVRRWAARWHRLASVALAAFAAVTVAVGPFVASLLGRHDAAGLDAMAVAGAVWILLCLDRGLLQAQRHYRALSANLLTEGGLRTVTMLALVGAGFGVTGAALGMLLAEVGTAVHARVAADRTWRRASPGEPPVEPVAAAAAARPPGAAGVAGSGARDLVTALVSLAMIAVLQSVDVIVMGREGPSVSGAYGAVSVASKALVFAALVVGYYLLPEAAIRWRSGGHALHQLAVTLLLLGVPGAVLVVVAAGAPARFLSTVFAPRYVAAAGAFLPLALAMVCLSTTVVVTMYLLAVGDRRIPWLLAAGAAAAIGAVAAAGGHPQATATADLVVQGVVLAAAGLDLADVHVRRRRAISV